MYCSSEYEAEWHISYILWVVHTLNIKSESQNVFSSRLYNTMCPERTLVWLHQCPGVLKTNKLMYHSHCLWKWSVGDTQASPAAVGLKPVSRHWNRGVRLTLRSNNNLWTKSSKIRQKTVKYTGMNVIRKTCGQCRICDHFRRTVCRATVPSKKSVNWVTRMYTPTLHNGRSSRRILFTIPSAPVCTCVNVSVSAACLTHE